MSNLENLNSELDRVEIAPEAIELIIGIAVSKMKDVTVVQNRTAANVADFISISLTKKGVSLYVNDEGDFAADIYVALPYGVSIPKVSKQIQERVKEQVFFMCEVEIKEVNVHVAHLVSGKGEGFEK